MTNKVEKVLLLGDGQVAADLLQELTGNGVAVDYFLHEGPIPAWKAETFEFLKAQEAGLDLAQYQAVVMAFASEKDVQRRIVQDLEPQAATDTLFLVSAMSLAATEIASWCQHPERVIGFGFVPPLAGVKCVELCVPLQADASRETYGRQAEALFAQLEREAAFVKDSAGLVMPRLVSMIVNEAVTALMEGVASADDLDTAMKLGVNYPQGPLAWADRIGLDQVYATLLGVYEEQGEDRYRPAPLLRRMVLAGQYGARVGRGFYQYEAAKQGEGVTENA